MLENDIKLLLSRYGKHVKKLALKTLSGKKISDQKRADALRQVVINCPNIEYLDLTHFLPVTTTDLQCFAKLHHLKGLFFKNQHITNVGLKSIGEGCTELETVHFRRCRMWDNGVTKLIEGCPKLKDIRLSTSTKISDATLECISKQCPDLQILDMEYTTISDMGLKYIANGCPKLEEINLSHCQKITDKGLKILARHSQNLKVAKLLQCYNITDKGVEALQKCPNFQSMECQICNQ